MTTLRIAALATFGAITLFAAAACDREPATDQGTAAETTQATVASSGDAAGAAARAQPGPEVAEALHRRLIETVTAGDVDGAVALFIEDANVWGAFGCVPNCLGRPAIRAALEKTVANHWRAEAVEIETLRTSHTTWTVSRMDVRGDDVTAAGSERVRAGLAMAVRDGFQIASIRGAADMSDEQTTRYLRRPDAPAAPGPRAAPSPEPSANGRFVDVGDGRRIYMECMGEGSPTVVFEGGSSAVRGAASSGVWTGFGGQAIHIDVQQRVAKVTRACAYDPAGVALSDPRPRPSTGGADAEDMQRLLHAAGIAPPYVVAGISYGGQVAQLFASMYPAETAGVVLLDTSPGWGLYERLAAVLPPAAVERQRAALRQVWQQAATPQGLAGGTDQEATLNELRAMGPLPDVPLAVLTAGIPWHPWNLPPDWDVQTREQIRYDEQAALAKLSPRGTHRIADSSEHGMNAFVPGPIAETIVEVVQAARRGAR